MSEADIPEAIRLLCEGFPSRSPAYWAVGLDRLARRDPVPNTVRMGHAMFEGGAMRGIVLGIPSLHGRRCGADTFVNISSWCVQPSHRGAPARALYEYGSSRHPDVTYTNLSAMPHTLKAITAGGFQQWTAGQLLCVGIRRGSQRVAAIPPRDSQRAGLPEPLAHTLVEHEGIACVCFCLETPTGLAPFIFLPRRVKSLRCAQLIYCESLDDLVSNGRAISALLAKRGFPAMIVDANGPLPGLLGRYFPGRASKYFKGQHPTFAIDHTYSEMTLFGF